jgi:hypothetical protein
MPTVLAALWCGAMAGAEPAPVGPDRAAVDIAPVVMKEPATPWKMRRMILDEDPFVATPPPTTEQEQVVLEVRVISDAGLGLLHARDRVTLLTPAQMAEMLAALAAHGEAKRIDLRVALVSGQRRAVAVGRRRHFLTGYSFENERPDAVIEGFQEGLRSGFRVEARPDGTRIIEASTLQRRATAEMYWALTRNSPDEREPSPHPWEELTFHESSVVPLPAEGIVVPTGGSLLLPSTGPVVRHLTPAAVSNDSDDDATPWWMLISPVMPAPTDAIDPEQPLPHARS